MITSFEEALAASFLAICIIIYLVIQHQINT